MTIRTTVAFDPGTVARWERLAKRWGVSKSETLRRALEAAETPPAPVASLEESSSRLSLTDEEIERMTPQEAFAWLSEHPSPPVPGGWGADPHRELREMRESDARLEEERERERRGAAASVREP
ncbi:MAG: hypothetical protein KIT22_10705 [Verrucomicrobiae bacterium]|nr:hypothetical protein [Verrucomicrobiae bacterium]